MNEPSTTLTPISFTSQGEERLLEDFFGNKCYDVRQCKDSVWICPECFSNIIWAIAKSINEYYREAKSKFFTPSDIWRSPFAREMVPAYIGKEFPMQNEDEAEYDKFFHNPMEMLSYIGVLGKIVNSCGKKQFSIAHNDIFSFVAENDIKTCAFLVHYFEKTLKDTGAWQPFAVFLENQTPESLTKLEDHFAKLLAQGNSMISTQEVSWSFPTMLNAIAFHFGKRGIVDGEMSREKILFSDLHHSLSTHKANGNG